MNATQTRLNNMTVKALREIGRESRIQGLSGLRKAELVHALTVWIEGCHTEAIEMNAAIDEAYTGMAEDAGMSIPAYLACQKAHTRNGEIFLSGLWNTPIAQMQKVITFDDGTRHGVSNADACLFSGKVTDMPRGEIGKCVHCKHVTLAPERVSVKDSIDGVISVARAAIKALTPALLATKLEFEMLRDCGTASEHVIDLAYQVYADTLRAIEEYQRTIAYAAGEHTCENHYSEIGMTEECESGCKIYRCSKCQDEATVHNPTYGCRYSG